MSVAASSTMVESIMGVDDHHRWDLKNKMHAGNAAASNGQKAQLGEYKSWLETFGGKARVQAVDVDDDEEDGEHDAVVPMPSSPANRSNARRRTSGGTPAKIAPSGGRQRQKRMGDMEVIEI